MSKQAMFSRYELKYMIPLSTMRALVADMGDRIRADRFGDASGKYDIVSLYFESPDYRIYYETKNRLPFRQKLRLRVYNQSELDGAAFFEIKQKFKNVVNKRRTTIRLRDAYDWIDSGCWTPPAADTDPSLAPNRSILNEIDCFRSSYSLQPKTVISYTRFAYQGVQEPDLRITFDTELTCRQDNLRIEDGGHGRHFVDPELVIMEVKVTHSVPLWLTRLLSKYECPNKSVSKFCTSIELLNQIEDTGALRQNREEAVYHLLKRAE